MIRKAIVDLGTNTFNLLVADVSEAGISIIHSERFPVMLGMGGINDGRIAEDAMIRAKMTLRNYVETGKRFKVESQQGFGTSALRDAVNRDELLHFALNELKLPISVISGEEEAQLIHAGVSWIHPFEKPSLIMDIGGGSTEFITASREEVLQILSLNIGVSRIFQLLDRPVDFSESDMHGVKSFLNLFTSDLLALKGPLELIGASGTFETFYEMIFEKEYVPSNSTELLPMADLMRVLHWSINSSYEERLSNKWVTEMRKSMLPIAAAKVLWVIETLGIEGVILSPYSLKEGALKGIS